MRFLRLCADERVSPDTGGGPDTPYASANSNKRPFEQSPPQNQQYPASPSLFSSTNGASFPTSQNGGARTIYSNSKLGFGGPPSGVAQGHANGGGQADQDSYAAGTMYQGERFTGMGRQASNDNLMPPGMQSNPMAPQQEAPRKRLRRGGPGPGDGDDEGPGSFTANLQSRLDGVHVQSGPPSAASSQYGGSVGPSISATPSYTGGPGTPQPQPYPQTAPTHGSASPSLSSSVPPSSLPPSAVHDSGFQAFRTSIGASFSPEQAWQAWQAGGGDQLRAMQIVLNAKPATPAMGPGTGSPRLSSSMPLSGGATTSQLGQGQFSAYAASPGPGPGTPGAGHVYPSQQPPAHFPSQQHQQHQQQQQQPRPQIQMTTRTVPVPVGQPGQQPGYGAPHARMPPNGQMGMPPNQQAAMLQQQQQQQQQQMAVAQAQGQPGYRQQPVPSQAYPPPQSQQAPTQPFNFPIASVGVAGMSAAHCSHYIQLQEGYRRGAITPDEYKQLMQYLTVLNKFLAAGQQGARRPAGTAGGAPPGSRPPGPQGYYPPQGSGQFHPQAYSTQGVYAAQPGYGMRPGVPPQQQQQRSQQQYAAAYAAHQQQQAQVQRAPAIPKPPPVPKHQAPLTGGAILARQLQLAGGFSAKKKKPVKKKGYGAGSDSEDDGGDYDSAGSGDEYGSKETPAQIMKREAIAVEFFNDGSKEQLMELAGCNATQATLTMKLRPFQSANDFRTRTRKQKGVGNNMMDTYLEVISGMSEVDKVLSECEQIGRELSAVMQIWASGAAASSTTEATRPGATMANDVGLDLVAISEETITQRVDTSQDPRVIEAFKDYIRRQPEGVPEGIKLKDYQMLGVNWLNLLYKRGTSCILADEMGLGKTAQVIALLAHLKATDPEESPHLVIVPSSTLDNWMREFSVFAPNLNVHSYYGSQGERAEIRHDLRRMEDLDVVVTTYNIATGSPDDQKFLKKKMDFKVCVFDEGHQLKNSDSKKYKDLMQVRAEWRLLLTGTPLQNNLQELVSLLSFILPEQFRDANESLRAIFKVQGGSPTNLLSRERINRAKKMMTPFVLRRKKAQVLKDLPKKLERIELCDMTELQRKVYDEAVQRSRSTLSGVKDEELEEIEGEDEDEGDLAAQEEGSKKKAPSRKQKAVASTKMGNKANVASSAHVLTDLRKASNHPMLFRRLYDLKKLRQMAKDCLREEEFLDRDQNLIFEDMEVMTDFELHRFCLGYKHLEKHCLQNDEWMSAGKIQKLQQLLPEMQQKGDRVLIFSQFVQVLDILEVVLDTMSMKYLKLTGQTQVADRQGLVDAFNQNEDITVFLLSTRAGGLGLNLTAANTVIFYDCDYNPHNDKQAEDRAYRIGQTRDVNIIRLVTRNSLDEAMLDLANAKLKLDSEVSGNATQQPGAAGDAAADGAENDGGAEKRMKKSLLSGLKKQFELESQTQDQSQTQPTGE
ncbi:hypothetical protein JCM11641_003285 [Rhodosporidiobolus odoratus]